MTAAHSIHVRTLLLISLDGRRTVKEPSKRPAGKCYFDAWSPRTGSMSSQSRNSCSALAYEEPLHALGEVRVRPRK
jgi:hypothetical protein